MLLGQRGLSHHGVGARGRRYNVATRGPSLRGLANREERKEKWGGGVGRGRGGEEGRRGWGKGRREDGGEEEEGEEGRRERGEGKRGDGGRGGGKTGRGGGGVGRMKEGGQEDGGGDGGRETGRSGEVEGREWKKGGRGRKRRESTGHSVMSLVHAAAMK